VPQAFSGLLLPWWTLRETRAGGAWSKEPVKTRIWERRCSRAGVGFQGAQVGSPDHVLACVKHFAGYGAARAAATTIRHNPEEQLWNVYLPPLRLRWMQARAAS